jgi:hypothetical protein
MTAENLARHAPNNPHASFWTMLKAGSDSFLETGKPPAIAVCDHRYVFNPPAADKDLDPSAPCPPDIASTSVAEDAQWSKSTVSVSAPSHQPPAERKETFLRKRFAGPRKVHREARSRRLAVEPARDVADDQYVFPAVTTTFRLPR